MSTRKTIVFLGAPTKEDVLKTWKGEKLAQTDDFSSLPLFQAYPQESSQGVAWRRLADPVDSLSQEFAETTVDTRVPDDFLERSLQIFDGEDEENEDKMDVYQPCEYPSLSNSSISSPFLTGYDFDVNEITELEDLPSATVVHRHGADNYSIIVAVMEISACQNITTKFGKSINLVKLTVADQTRSNFEIACWDTMAILCQSLRLQDIIHFRGSSRYALK